MAMEYMRLRQKKAYNMEIEEMKADLDRHTKYVYRCEHCKHYTTKQVENKYCYVTREYCKGMIIPDCGGCGQFERREM